MAKMEKDIIDLNPKALIVGQGLWYPMEYPNSNYYVIYKNDLREKMKDFVALNRKVVKETFSLVNYSHNRFYFLTYYSMGSKS